MFHHTSVFDVVVNPEMPRNRSKSVPKGNGPVPHHDEFRSGEPTMAELYRMLKQEIDRMDKNFKRMVSCFD